MHDDIPPFSLFKDIVPFIILLCNIRKVYLCKKISRHAASWLFVVSNVREVVLNYGKMWLKKAW